MKRHGNLFNRIIDMENLLLAHDNARRGKTHYRDVKMVDLDPARYAKEIQRMLRDQTYEVGDYDIITRTVDSGKVRTIFRLGYYRSELPFRAQIALNKTYYTFTGATNESVA